LRPLGAFEPVTPEELTFIQDHKAGEPTLKAGAAIVREGEQAERLYTLLWGWAFRFKTMPDGRRQILNILLPGDLVGLQAKLFQEASHGIEALTEVTLCAFARERTWEVFRSFPALAFDLTWLGAREERFVDDVLLSVGRRTAAERLGMLILHLWCRARLLGMVQDGALAFPLTQAHIADTLGLSYVHTNRTMQELRRQRLFDLSNGVLAAMDEEGLRRLSGFEEVEQSRPLF
jgi:CRP/FNR family transcriptional regulator, anaerobic regulatory protein